ncbi:MAG: hypothetical protein AVDCRST_MAG96-3427 [uncultured Segetibacter sp.]|uniref:Uncharacterized protein n=1 Tax=uncultured Segetibacter sp. TaxID=481133 RepID=A0A6J4TRR2_9BACT|nr:MAG: hypothetical protein AVDCRST_MAG96-3427 [uncultured Segetibacter sp.]
MLPFSYLLVVVQLTGFSEMEYAISAHCFFSLVLSFKNIADAQSVSFDLLNECFF